MWSNMDMDAHKIPLNGFQQLFALLLGVLYCVVSEFLCKPFCASTQ